MNLNQVSISVSDMPTAVAFYLQMGFTQIVDTPHYARFVCPLGGSTFSLLLEADAKHHSGAIIYFEYEQLDTWVDELQQRGIQFESLPEDMPYLWREAVLLDPSGNKIKLYWAGKNRLNPPWRVEITGSTPRERLD